MISVRLLTRDEVAAKLQAWDCEIVQDTPSPVPDTELWRCAALGHHFFVPIVGPDRMTAEYILEGIVDELKRLFPTPN